MRTTILLTSDSKFAAQLETWLRQVAPEKMRTETYLSLDAYTDMLGREADVVAKAAGDAAPQTTTQLAKPQKKIGLFIVDADLMGPRPLSWLQNLQDVTREKAPFLIGEEAPKVLVMAYEGGSPRIQIFQCDLVDDLILKPVDKTLFQQKVEILISDSRRITPSFLFRARTEEIIEVGYDIEIDELSEFAVGIRTPEPLKAGTFATIHADLFGEKSERHLIGRVYECVNHPVREGEYLARFSLFGLRPNQLSAIRHYIRANQTSMRTKMWSPPGPPIRTKRVAGPGARTAVIARGEDGINENTAKPARTHKIAIIDMNFEAREEAKSILESNFKNVTIRSFSSLIRLSEEIKKLTGAPAAEKRAVTRENSAEIEEIEIESLLEAGPSEKKRLTLFLRGKTHEVLRFEPFVKKYETVFGQPASSWLENPERFKSSIIPGDRAAFEEFLSCIESGASGTTMFRMPLAHGRAVYLEGKGRLDKSGASDGSQVIQIDLAELSAEEWNQKFQAIEGTGTGGQTVRPEDFQFDLILIDSAYLQAGPDKWFESFVELLRNSRILKSTDSPPKIFVMADPRSEPRIEDYRVDGIFDFLFKPLDRRLLIQKLCAAMPTLLLAREIDPQPWLPTELPAILGREALMEEMSEYGLVIRHPTPFDPRAFARFFTTLFGEDVWILGRSYGSEEIEGSEEYRCQFLFFGQSDELLKKIRRWIREDYVARKDVNA